MVYPMTTDTSKPNAADANSAGTSPAQAKLNALLADAALRDRKVQRKTRLAQGGWLWLCTLLAVVVYDAISPWHGEGRLIVTGLLLVLGVLHVVRTFCVPAPNTSNAHIKTTRRRGKQQTAFDAASTMPVSGARANWHAALALENHHGLSDNPMVNALWLAQQNDESRVKGEGQSDAHALTRSLRERSIAVGAMAASQADIAGSIDRRPLSFHRWRLAAIVALWLVLALLMPRMVTGGLMRFVNPWGDHPPFSLTRFVVTLPVDEITQGSDVTAEITIKGQHPATLDWVELEPASTFSGFREVRRWRLEPESPGKYRRRLRRLDTDVMFQLEAGHSRSSRYAIHVVPRLMETAGPEDPPTPGPEPTATSQPQANGQDSAVSDNPAVQAAAAAQQNLAQAAGRLAEAAERLQQSIEAGQARGQQSLTAEQLAQAQDVARQLEAFKRMKQEMQEQLDSASKGMNDQPRDKALLDQMARTLESLLTPKEDGPEALKNPNAESMGQCMSQIASSARSDQAKLSLPTMSVGKSPGESLNPSGETTGGGDEQAKLPDDGTDILRSGSYHQEDGRKGSPVLPTTARGRAVPEIYRPMVEQYFDRINQDQSSPAQSSPAQSSPVQSSPTGATQ